MPTGSASHAAYLRVLIWHLLLLRNGLISNRTSLPLHSRVFCVALHCTEGFVYTYEFQGVLCKIVAVTQVANAFKPG